MQKLKVIEIKSSPLEERLRELIEKHKDEIKNIEADDIIVLSFNKKSGELSVIADPDELPVRHICSRLMEAYQHLFAAMVVRAAVESLT